MDRDPAWPADLRRAITAGEARRRGVSRHELAGPLWCRPHRGVRLWVPGLHDDPWPRVAAAAALVPPDGALGGWAAAWALGARYLDGRDIDDAVRDVVVVVPPSRQLRHRPGLRVTRAPLVADDRLLLDGVPVTSPTRTCFDLVRTGPLADAVVAVDLMLAAGLVTRAGMAAYIEAHSGWRGVPQARAALALSRERVGSPWETRLRLLWTSSGLPCPQVNLPLYDADGDFLAMPDLLDEEAGVVGEYNGAVHRGGQQRERDHARERRMWRAGLIVVPVTGVDLLRRPGALLRDIEDAVRKGRRRDRRRDRWSTRSKEEWITWFLEQDDPV
jgi:hypothetical protein